MRPPTRYDGGMPIPDFVPRDLETLGFDLPQELLDQLERYLDLVLKANETTNLTAIKHRELAWSRLIVDSLTPLPAMAHDDDDEGDEGEGDQEEGDQNQASTSDQASDQDSDQDQDASRPNNAPPLKLIDIGTGAGLPGIPLAIARPDVDVTLVDGTGKKIRFLESVVAELGLTNVTPLNARVEDVGQDPAHRGRYDIAVSRAVGPLPVVLEYSLPLLKLGGVMLAMKGPKAEQELRDSGDAMSLLGGGEVTVVEAYPESFDNELVIVMVAKEDATPSMYPRVSGTPKKEPL